MMLNGNVTAIRTAKTFTDVPNTPLYRAHKRIIGMIMAL